MITEEIAKEYIKRKIFFYKELEEKINFNQEIIESVVINQSFINSLEEEFKDFISLRKKSKKMNRKDISKFKREFEETNPLIRDISNINKPAIYWFEISTNNEDIKDVNNLILEKFESKRKHRSGAWTKKNSNAKESAKILYLGKSEKDLYGRFIQHLGLGHKTISALKIRFWFGKDERWKDIEFKFKYMVFENDMKKYLKDIENLCWRNCNPLIGGEPDLD